jgi:ABC-type Fe3+-hydroxamate transport system substrate-binding protein
MKNLLQVLMALFIASVLTACGGETSTGSSSAAASSDSAELIIDNGRGTINGSDTEKPKK